MSSAKTVDNSSPQQRSGLPTHETVYRTIRDKVLFGDLKPGQAVTINGLVDELGVSMTPVREAIRRLTAAGALEFLGNRRVCVPVMGAARFRELTQARLAIEPKLSKIAARKITDQQIDRLDSIDQALDTAIENNDVHGYMRQNHLFHFTMYTVAEAQIFQSLANTLWLRFGPISRIIAGTFGPEIQEDHHKEAIAALRAKDPNAVGDAIRQDIRHGFDIVRASFDWSEI